MSDPSLSYEYFERLYAENSDPWNFAGSIYEAQKYAESIAMLGPVRFVRALEIGCSIGVLTEQLAARCERLVSIDINERALAAAAFRNRNRNNVSFARMTVPADMPQGIFDLVVLSEVGYYWSDADLASARTRIAEAAPNGTVELVHFLPKVADYPRDGDAVHEAFLADPRYRAVRSSRAERYRIDVLHVRP